MAMSDKEFYISLSRVLDTSIPTVKKYWEGFVEAIIRNVYFNEECHLPGLGEIRVKHIDAYEQKQKSGNGDYVYYKVPEHNKPYFEPCDNFVNDINMGGVTKAYRKRVKANKMTKHDLARIAKAQAYERLKNVTDEDKKKADANFLELLAQKKAEHEERNETNRTD